MGYAGEYFNCATSASRRICGTGSRRNCENGSSRWHDRSNLHYASSSPHHLHHANPIVLEGDGLLPAFARQQPHGVRSLFLVADDEERVAQAMRQRSRGFEERTPDEQLAQIRLNWLFGQWLREEAQRLTLPVLNARPRETLLDRALDLLL